MSRLYRRLDSSLLVSNHLKALTDDSHIYFHLLYADILL